MMTFQQLERMARIKTALKAIFWVLFSLTMAVLPFVVLFIAYSD